MKSKNTVGIAVLIALTMAFALSQYRSTANPVSPQLEIVKQLKEQFGPLIQVTSDSDNQTVLEIKLDAQGLESAETFKLLSQLSDLQSLSLKHGTFSDDDLTPLSTLTRLQSLHLQSLHFSGSGLQYLSDAKMLTTLNLSNNPSWDNANAHWIQQFPLLSNIRFAYTPVTNQTLTALRRHDKLSTVQLDHTAITFDGLAQLNSCHELSMLSLRGCQLTGKDTQIFPKLETPQPIHLDFANASIRDRDLDNIHQLDLQFLNLSGTSVTDETLYHIGKQGICQQLDISNTHCSHSAISTVIRQLPLVSLSMRGFHVDPSVLESLATCPSLSTLDLAQTNMHDNWIELLASCKSLNNLILFQTDVRGETFDTLADLPEFTYLDLSHCPVNKRGIQQLQRLPSLTSLQLMGAQLDNSAFEAIAELPITHLNVSGSTLTSTGLLQLSTMSELKELVIRNCDIQPADYEMFQTRNTDCVIYWQAYGFDSVYAVPEAMKYLTPRQ